jgi:type I restriction enzyme S subunit
MPSIEEQQKIAEYLAATCGEIDELVVANERTIEKLKEYRQSVIYEAVTGKIEV